MIQIAFEDGAHYDEGRQCIFFSGLVRNWTRVRFGITIDALVELFAAPAHPAKPDTVYRVAYGAHRNAIQDAARKWLSARPGASEIILTAEHFRPSIVRTKRLA